LENVGLIAMTLDKNGLVTFCNDCLLQLTGWKREEVSAQIGVQNSFLIHVRKSEKFL